METLIDILSEGAQSWGTLPAVSLHGDNPQQWTYAELWDTARRVAAHLREQGIAKGDRVILWGDNRPEWVASYFGILALGAIVVPLDVRSPADLFQRVREAADPKLLILGPEQRNVAEQTNLAFLPLEELKDRVADANPIDPKENPVAAADIAELVFTSGTTGNPKGVILTHHNIVANIRAARAHFPASTKNRVLSILPLSHMLEQIGGLLVPMTGGAWITYVETLRPDVIFSAMAHQKITNMSCVPKVLELFSDGIKREIRRRGKESQFQRIHSLAQHLPLSWRRRLFGKIHQRMGGNFQYFVAGGARLDPELARWWEGLGIKVIQGYGMTEASPVVAAGTLSDRVHGSVGRPLPGVGVKIGEDDEILVQGENLTPGYWQNPEATAAAFTDGWYHTGDQGYLDPAGRLHILGRRDFMIVLPTGQNVYPEDLEQELLADHRVRDVVVLDLGQNGEVEIHAVLIADEPGQAAEIVREANRRLSAHQRIEGFTLWPDESFPMTPTLKPKRRDIIERLAELQANK